MLGNFFIIPAVREKIRAKLALAIPTAAPTTLVKEMIDTPPLVALKTNKTLSMSSKTVTFIVTFNSSLIFYCIVFFDLVLP